MPRTAARRAAALAAALVLAAGAAGAQSAAPGLPAAAYGRGLELRPFAGAVLPTGDQRDLLKDAALVGAQAGWAFHPNFALTGGFGWSPGKDRTTGARGNALFTGRDETVDLFQYDLGVEGRLPLRTSGAWTATPYLALGGGGRTFRYRDVDGAGSQTSPFGYGAVGLDVAPRAGAVGLRVEARDNVTAFKGLRGELADRTGRNDVQLTAGLTYRF
jgi:hypothetical protein